MSDREDQEEIIRNPETRNRRAWVERALEGVRRRLASEQGLPECGDATPERPNLYVLRSGRSR
ncbi:MAG: hypothetical protein FJ197_06685 [Gammaproteobacteria bacterium]|nr:hypothetical protein [Gammaproteobacteria bacterium]